MIFLVKTGFLFFKKIRAIPPHQFFSKICEGDRAFLQPFACKGWIQSLSLVLARFFLIKSPRLDFRSWLVNKAELLTSSDQPMRSGAGRIEISIKITRRSTLDCSLKGKFHTCVSFALLLFVFSLFLFSEISAKEGIFLKPRAMIHSSGVKLGDIANFDDKNFNIQLFENLKSPKILSVSELEGILKSKGILQKVFGNHCLIIPFTEEFSKSELGDSLGKEIISRTGLKEDDFKLTYTGKEIALPKSGVEFRWANFPKNLIPGRRIFPLDVYFENEKIYTARLNFLLEKKIIAAISKRKIFKGSILKKEDYELKAIYSEEDDKDLFSADIAGYTVLGEIEENKPIRKKEIRNSFLVEKGAEVTIVFTKGNIVVKGKGRAKSSGNMGELVQIHGHSSRTILNARVADRGSVIIE